VVEELEIIADGLENSERKIKLVKIPQAYDLFKELISYHAIVQLLGLIKTGQFKSLADLQEAIPSRTTISAWVNIGGQLVQQISIDGFIQQIHKGKIKDWEQVHAFYKKQGENIRRINYNMRWQY